MLQALSNSSYFGDYLVCYSTIMPKVTSDMHQQDLQPSSFLLLRGIHNLDMVPAIKACAEQADVIFMELVATKEVRHDLQRFMLMYTYDAVAQEQVEQLEQSGDNSLFVTIAKALRGTQIPFMLIDKDLKGTVNESSSYFSDSLGISKLKHAEKTLRTTGDLEQFYASAQDILCEAALDIHRRNALVAKQVKHTIDNLLAKAIPCKRVVIIQGFMHKIAPALRLYYPHVEYKEQTYNTQLVEHLLKTPFFAMQIYALGGKPIPLRKLQEYLYLVLQSKEFIPLTTDKQLIATTDSRNSTISTSIEDAARELGRLQDEVLAKKVNALLKKAQEEDNA